MRRIIAPLIGVLAILGLGDSAYLVLRHLGILGSESLVVASACEIGDGACASVAQSDVGTLFGVPAPVWGGLYFAAVVMIVIVRLHLGRWLFPYVTLAVLTAGLGYSGYLVYSLVVLDEPCPYCLFAHSINAAVFVLFLLSLRMDRPRARSSA